MRVLLVDGANNFIRNYMVNTSATYNSVPCGGVVGFLNSLRSCVSLIKPQRIVVFWDGPNGSKQKRQILKEYKSGRKPKLIVGQNYLFSEEKMEENRDWQQNLCIELIKHLPVCQIVTDSFEADDGIGYVCTNKKYFNFKPCIILTSDKDFYQLLDGSTAIYNPIQKKLITQKSLLEEEKIHPDNWLFYKSILGDKSDNIKGVKSIGEKTVKRMYDLSTPLNLDMIYDDNEDPWRKKKIEKMRENKEIIERNFKLMDLRSPLMSLSHKNFVTSKIEDFEPESSSKNFFIETKKNELPIDSNMFLDFLNLQ